ncbi:MAG: hypothetical protein CM15mP129_05970 [Chloroflexota bacterium]|nr:MAG: hypothetical protein CM15mP129_05970 [Chloroflexota bacterium]
MVGLINDHSVNIIFLFLLLISTSIYLKWRPIYSDSKMRQSKKFIFSYEDNLFSAKT